MSEGQNMSAWIRLMLEEIEQKQAEAIESAEEEQRRTGHPAITVGAASAANPDADQRDASPEVASRAAATKG